jgi:carbamoyl-phosphate synthase large subunit
VTPITADGRPPHVLITASGRRASLVQAFREAAGPRGGRIYAGDVDPLAPSLFLADEAVRLRPTNDPEYIADLLGTVERCGIRLVVPTIDTDLAILAANVPAFETFGCQVAISSEAFVAVALDKLETGRTFGSAGIRVPRSWLPPFSANDGLPGQVFVKPRRGSASQHTYSVVREQLDSVVGLVPDPIAQEVLTGPEITIDALLDFTGRPIHYVPRRRIKTLGGESVEGVTLDHDPGLHDWIERVLELSSGFGGLGPLTLQAFQTETGLVLTEINARFGGGFPLGLAAGGSYPAWLLDMVEGRSVESRLGVYEAGLYMTRHNVEQFTRRPRW